MQTVLGESTVAVVLAAGKGTRMNSDLPKVLVPALGRPLIEYVLDALAVVGIGRTIVVVGYRADDVRQTLAGRPRLECVEQTPQLGTGHAVMVCREALGGHSGPVLVLAGDSPMVQADSLRALLIDFQQRRPACLLGTLHKEDPRGLGRIVRDSQGRFQGIVEEKDATAKQRQITEVNMSTYLFDGPALLESLNHLDNNNRQQEYYLTDCPRILLEQGREVDALPVLKPCEAFSVNTVEELRAVEVELDRIQSQ